MARWDMPYYATGLWSARGTTGKYRNRARLAHLTRKHDGPGSLVPQRLRKERERRQSCKMLVHLPRRKSVIGHAWRGRWSWPAVGAEEGATTVGGGTRSCGRQVEARGGHDGAGTERPHIANCTYGVG